MKVVNEKFQDNNLEVTDYVIKSVSRMYYENAQLYGALAKLMLETSTDDFELTIEDRDMIGKNYSVHFVKANDDENDKTAKIILVKHEYTDEKED